MRIHKLAAGTCNSTFSCNSIPATGWNLRSSFQFANQLVISVGMVLMTFSLIMTSADTYTLMCSLQHTSEGLCLSCKEKQPSVVQADSANTLPHRKLLLENTRCHAAIYRDAELCMLACTPAVQVALIQVCVHTLGQSNASFLRTSGHICNLGHYCR